MTIRGFTCAALITTGALAIAAPAASATPEPRQPDSGDYGLWVKPVSAVPGQRVSVSFLCVGQKLQLGNFTAPMLRVTSSKESPDWVHTASATVKDDAKPGTYTLTYQCPGQGNGLLKAKFTVVAPKGKAPQQPKQQQVKVKPKGGAQTGGGATAS